LERTRRKRGGIINAHRGAPLNKTLAVMSEAAKAVLQKLEENLRFVDESALVILKGHLIIEETLTEIISTFVFHAEQLEGARLSFSQKVAIARSMSLDEHNNEMWQLIAAINRLRNELAHALSSPKRVEKTKALLNLHEKLGGIMTTDEKETPEHILLSFSVTYSLGFLSGFLEEVRRFKSMLEDMDRIVNPHRHQ
jgi:hypothetical protein